MYMYIPKILAPCFDSNPGSSGLEADTMTIMPRHQGIGQPFIILFFEKFPPYYNS
jgi:hypothetical protein